MNSSEFFAAPIYETDVPNMDKDDPSDAAAGYLTAVVGER